MLPGGCHMLLLCQGSGTHVRSLFRLLRGLQQGPAILKGISSSGMLSPFDVKENPPPPTRGEYQADTAACHESLGSFESLLPLPATLVATEECDDCLVAMKCVAARLPPVRALSVDVAAMRNATSICQHDMGL